MGCFKVTASENRGWLEYLAYEMDDLKSIEFILENKIKREEMMQGQLRTEHVKSTLEKVMVLEEFVRSMSLVKYKMTCFPSVVNFINHIHSIKKIKNAITLVKSVKRDIEIFYKMDIKVLLNSSMKEQILHKWVDIKGRQSYLLKILKDETILTPPIIAIFGMGGVGKTSLMRKVYNTIKDEATTSSVERDTMIEWIDVSVDCSISHIQSKIAKALNLSLSDDGDVQADAVSIFDACRMKKKCILFMDDVRYALDFKRIGIPVAEYDDKHYKSVVIFTTRNSKVCSNMKSQLFEVPLLDETESKQLLKECLGNDSGVENMDDQLRKCGGLPLAIEVLTSKTLGERSSSFKYRFGILTNEEISCLLYCSLVESVKVGHVVDQIVGEDIFLQCSSNVFAAKEKIHDVIKSLESMNLLQIDQSEDGEYLKMHNLIKEVLLLDTDREYLAINCNNSTQSRNWVTAKRVVLSFPGAEELLEMSPLCLNLHSLLIRKHSIAYVPSNSFTYMPALRVLDLSHCEITSLPETIKCLTELRYLNLSFTKLISLPFELGRLEKLRQLYLTGTYALDSIQRKSFCGLVRLRALDFVASKFWDNTENDDPSRLKLEDLKIMLYLEAFSMTINSATSLVGLLMLDKLCQATKGLVLRNIDDTGLILKLIEKIRDLKELKFIKSRACDEILVCNGQLVDLEELSFNNCDLYKIVLNGNRTGEPYFHNLRHLRISSCHKMSDIYWVQSAPSLKYLDINSCNGMKELFLLGGQGREKIIFSNLQILKLSSMNSLRILCMGILSLPSLKELKISGCRHLKEHHFQQEIMGCHKMVINNDDFCWTAGMLLPKNIWISLSPNAWSILYQGEIAVQEEKKNENVEELPASTSEVEHMDNTVTLEGNINDSPEKSVQTYKPEISKPDEWVDQKDRLPKLLTQKSVEDTLNIENICSLELKDDPDILDVSEIDISLSSKAEDTELSSAKETTRYPDLEKPAEFLRDPINQVKPEPRKSESKDKEDMDFLLQSAIQRNSVWVDQKQRFSKLSKLLKDETIEKDQIIGILGMVGVGKTALMREVYADLVNVPKTVVIWIQVSANHNVICIQNQIAKALKLHLPDNNDVQARASTIFGALSLENNRILFLDDVAHALDFEVIGIPTHNDYKHQTGSVLIFTTRYPQVCIDMKAQVYQVPFLDEKESCELFKKHLGLKEDFQLKRHQKENLNQECDGLPLAVALLAKEVKKRSTDITFADSLSFLSFRVLFDNCPDAMKDTIAAVKRDFSRLTDEEISCMCYCSLLGDVEVEKGVNILVGEGGILDLSSSFAVAKEKKITTLKKLEELNLLQRYLLDWNAEHLKIQNFIKKVILMDHRLDHLRIKSTDKSLFRNWETATRVKISLQDGEDLPEEAPLSNKLHSLLMGVDEIVPGSFFSRMPFLRVLDLSGNNITFLPESIGCLMELQYLNLSYTRIEFLPSELGNLKRLRQLYLRCTFSLKDVPKDAISGLAALQVLDFLSSAFNFNKKKEYPSLLDLTDLEIMHYLEEFSITITEIASLSRLLSSNQLCLATMSLALKCINDGDLISQAFKSLPKINSLTIIESHPPEIRVSAGQLVSLEKLSFVSCNISKIVSDDYCMKESSMAPFRILWRLTIYGCSTLQDISWIRFAPSLKCLQVWSCHGIKELIKYKDNNQGKEPFSKLAFIKLAQNRSLENIYKGSLSLPSLRKLDIYDCPHFKEHLFREKNTDDPKAIIGESPYHWTADADDPLLPKYISPSIYHFPNDWSTPRPEEASEVPHDISNSGFDRTEPGTSQSRDNVMSKPGFNMIEPDTSQSRENEIRKSGFDMTEPGTSQSRDDETMKFRLESADNEGTRFRLRWLESLDDKDIGSPLEFSINDQTPDIWIDKKGRFSKLRKLVDDESNNREHIIGILGMVGIGKTALMRQLYKSFEEEVAQKHVISDCLIAWIQVSADPSVMRIQDQIAKALNFDLQNNNDIRARASCILRALGTKKRCILFLDDVADALDFERVGIPTWNEDSHEKKRVFIFTTRYSQVCFDMNAQIFEVPLLDTWESYELFKRHLSVSVDGSYEFKHKLQGECHGLPLAVQLLAREAEKRSTNISCDSDLSLTEMYRVNRDALNGALTAIFKPTRGRLTDEDISCLIYLSLVSDTERKYCISALVGKESNPNPSSSLSTAKEEMNSRMTKLESMHLLRRPDRIPKDIISTVEKRENKMHNFIKQTIMMGCHPDHVTVTSATECQLESWERARCVRISLPYNIRGGTELPDVFPICPKLHSLIIASGSIFGVPVGIPSSFFTHMPVLRVLDLSCTDITILPISVKYLLELQYLNLSFTRIESLPEELGNLTNLRQLYLKDTSRLEDVPRDIFSGLAKLQSLHFFGSSFEFKKRIEYLPQLELKDLEGMQHLEEFSATINNETLLGELLTTNLLRKVTVSLKLKFIKDDGGLVSQALETLSNMKEFSIFRSRVRKIHLSAGKQVSLEKLIMRNCDSFSKIDVGDATCWREPPSMAPFHALLHLEIIYCPEVRDISWVQLAPSLRFLTVAECNGIRELVVHNGSAHEIEPWSQLEYFQLIGNENLEIIYIGSLSLPSLIKVCIDRCPKLRKHHLQTNSTDSATVVIRIDCWEWTAVPDDLLLPKNIRPTVSYLPDDTCAPIEKATFSEQFQSEGMSSSKPKKPVFWTKLKGMTLVPLRKKHQGGNSYSFPESNGVGFLALRESEKEGEW